MLATAPDLRFIYTEAGGVGEHLLEFDLDHFNKTIKGLKLIKILTVDDQESNLKTLDSKLTHLRLQLASIEDRVERENSTVEVLRRQIDEFALEENALSTEIQKINRRTNEVKEQLSHSMHMEEMLKDQIIEKDRLSKMLNNLNKEFVTKKKETLDNLEMRFEKMRKEHMTGFNETLQQKIEEERALKASLKAVIQKQSAVDATCILN